MRYLTPTAYANAGEGLDTSALSRLEFANVIAKAEALVDAECNVDGLQPHTVTGEEALWDGVSRSVYPKSRPMPVTAITSFTIQVSTTSQGNMLYATVSPNDIVINNQFGYAEVVSLTTLTMSMTPVLINLGLIDPIVRMTYTVGWSFPVTGDQLFDDGDLLTFYGTRQFWDATKTITVYKNGVALAPSAYTLNAAEGSVAFSASLQPSDVVAADYAYVIPDRVRAATMQTVTAYLGERKLAQAGLTGLALARAGSQFQVERPRGVDSMQLPDTARKLLSVYKHIALGLG